MTLSYPQFQADEALHQSVAAAPTPTGFYHRGPKRALDLMLILVAVPFVLPLILLMAIAVKLDGGSAFYTQMRVGRGGKVFRMWKLRSMVINAEAKLEQHLAANPDARAEWNLTQKLRKDPRITRVGRVLRKTSMDELPQLWNVLMGNMSLVGPRPMMVSQQTLYPGKTYYALRPGITGLWQTAGRNKTSFEARADFDTRYGQTLSFRNDIGILIRTVSVVFRGTGC